jgi:uncharacterized protein YggT (Ycf19 family)
MRSNSLRKDEARRTEQFESVKGELGKQVRDEIKKKSANDDREKTGIESVAHELKEEAIHEVAATESEIARARTVARISQVINYLFGLIYGLIGLLIALELMGARESSGFKQFINLITAPLVAPFKGLMPDPRIGNYQLMLSYIIGLVVYGLLHLAMKGLLRLAGERETSI